MLSTFNARVPKWARKPIIVGMIVAAVFYCVLAGALTGAYSYLRALVEAVPEVWREAEKEN